MKRRTTPQAWLAPALLLALAGCSDGAGSSDGQDGEHRSDASDGRSEDASPSVPRDDATVDTRRDGGRDASSRDAYAGDAADRGQPDARAEGGSSAPDAAAADASAAPDGAAPSDLRARVCGDERGPASPFASGQRQLTATRVGSERFGFVEGPLWVEELGALLFSDMNFSGGDAKGPPSQIRKLTPPATFAVFTASSGSNGLALTADGEVIAATHDTQSLSKFDARTQARTDLTIRFQNRAFNSPNDLAVRSDGTVYFTDPDWQLGQRTRVAMGVYRVAPPIDSGRTLEAQLVDGMLDKPNGIALSPDEKTLYVGSTGNELWKYPVASDGSVGSRTKFADVGASDGLAVDCAGNVYVTSGTVEVFAPSGEKLGDIMTAEGPSNAAFGGAEHKTLYITAQTGLYAVELPLRGLPY